jgi:hypothetical protein
MARGPRWRRAAKERLLRLDELTSETLARAVAIYLARAYPEGGMPEAVAARARVPGDLAGEALVERMPFERVPPEAGPRAAQRLNLRLGNSAYAHMKLGLDRVSETDQWIFTVDTHDKHFAALVQSSEQEQYRQLRAWNERVKSEVESAWAAAGLPTFEQYLRGYLDRLHGQAEAEAHE